MHCVRILLVVISNEHADSADSLRCARLFIKRGLAALDQYDLARDFVLIQDNGFAVRERGDRLRESEDALQTVFGRPVRVRPRRYELATDVNRT